MTEYYYPSWLANSCYRYFRFFGVQNDGMKRHRGNEDERSTEYWPHRIQIRDGTKLASNGRAHLADTFTVFPLLFMFVWLCQTICHAKFDENISKIKNSFLNTLSCLQCSMCVCVCAIHETAFEKREHRLMADCRARIFSLMNIVPL